MSLFERCVVVTNGNLTSMIGLAPWLRKHEESISKIYVTPRLPSEKNNLKGVFRLLYKSGWDYTYLKVWLNRIAPLIAKLRGCPASLVEYIHAAKLDIEIEVVFTVNAPRIIEEIKSMGIELLVSYAATEKFCVSLVEAPTIGSINVHPSPLPAYAGLSPYFYQLLNNEPRFGFTLHRIVPRLDAGPVIEQYMEDTGDICTVLNMVLRMTELAEPMLSRFFEGETGFDKVYQQDISKRSYFKHPDKQQVKEFKKRGYKMLDAADKHRLFKKIERLALELKDS